MKLRQFLSLMSLAAATLGSITHAEDFPGGIRKITVLPTINTSREAELSQPIQAAVVQYLQQTQMFIVQVAPFVPAGFSEQDIEKLHEDIYGDSGEIFVIPSLSDTSVDILLFDALWPKHFIPGSRPRVDPTGGTLNSNQVIEINLRGALEETLGHYSKGEYTLLPGATKNEELVTLEESKAAERRDNEESTEGERRAKETRRIFRLLALIQDRPFYLGLSIGMARFAANESSASTVNFGGFGGRRFGERFAVELDVDVFAYLLVQANVRYRLPLAEKYVSFQASLGPGMILGSVSENRGFSSTLIPSGQLMVGPGFSFDIPLLGANIRGEIRFLIGGGSILVGNYGVSYNI